MQSKIQQKFLFLLFCQLLLLGKYCLVGNAHEMLPDNIHDAVAGKKYYAAPVSFICYLRAVLRNLPELLLASFCVFFLGFWHNTYYPVMVWKWASILLFRSIWGKSKHIFVHGCRGQSP